MTTPRGGADILERLEAMASGVSVRPDLAEGLPAYLLLQKTIQSGIETGHWKTGDRLPPERLLAEMAGMSVGTVKKAVLNLVSEGLLYRVRGRGTFVAGSSIARETRRYYLLLRDFDALNERDGTLAPETRWNIQFVDLKSVRAPAAACRSLGVPRGAACHELHRVFHDGGRPVVYTVSLLPKSLTPKLEAIPLHRLEKIPLYIILEESYSLPTRRTDELFGVAHADQEQARVLDVERGKALLRIDSVIYTYGNKPFEYRNAYCVTDSKMVYRTM